MTEPVGAADGWDCHVHVFDAAAPLRGGHYRPVHRPLVAIEDEAGRHGVGHLVLVQPSVYGSDNGLLLRALQAAPGRHRGVVVLADDVSDAELDAMHAAGVRGARLNRVSPVGEASDGVDVEARFRRLAPRLRERGWHLQWYVGAGQLPGLVRLHGDDAPVCVLDHLAGLSAAVPADHPAWSALATLAAGGAWLKLSGWYRLGATEPYDVLLPAVRRAAAMFGERLVWGSDWPHTSFEADRLPLYASTWQPVVNALGAEHAAVLRSAVPAIYR